MSDLNFVFEIAVMFIVRIGVPLLLLVSCDFLVGRIARPPHWFLLHFAGWFSGRSQPRHPRCFHSRHV